jgi:hypothetical protein
LCVSLSESTVIRLLKSQLARSIVTGSVAGA